MRIRKNTTLSSLLSAAGCGGEKTQTHVCHLNQSPWDVIPFTSSVDAAAAVLTNQLDSPWFLPSSSSCSHQFDGDDSFNGNVSLGDSYGAAESVVSVEKLGIIAEDNDEKSSDEEHSDRSDWKSSSNKAKKSKSKSHEPNSSQKTSGAKSGDQPNPASGTAVSPPRRGPESISIRHHDNESLRVLLLLGVRAAVGQKARRREEWGRGGEIGDEDGKTTTFGGEYNWEEEDDVVDQEGKVMTMMMMKKKKRGRKPVKARSLRSLV
ncbi:PREDICTED: uncharacterized protein LOC104801575 [Tarenaya hassleriana]|uniref:uncharacterized protein LOC104801575 n=1 Tax=Tarenaya hassleriana TaxID=28532 RepID=UPI0008FD03C1|nr:PREDICTED: uncharacterized protein LOC104801575 [Tarenaya hassleriana]